jgi:hypothetical protein
MALPDPQEIAYVGTPSKTQEVQFKGTIWEPFWTAGALRGGPEAHSVSTAADLTQACNTAIQDKVAWSRGGSKHWDASNLRDLCTGARTPSAIATCVSDGISAHNDWVRAIRECKGR